MEREREQSSKRKKMVIIIIVNTSRCRCAPAMLAGCLPSVEEIKVHIHTICETGRERESEGSWEGKVGKGRASYPPQDCKLLCTITYGRVDGEESQPHLPCLSEQRESDERECLPGTGVNEWIMGC